MGKNQQASENLRGSAEASPSVCYKGTKMKLSKLQYQLFITLSGGNKHSSYQLMQQLHTSDSRKGVQYLRKKGVAVLDEVVAKTSTIPRHKLYWIDPKECSSEQPLL